MCIVILWHVTLSRWSCLFPPCLTLRPWRWRWFIPQKCWQTSTKLDGVTSHLLLLVLKYYMFWPLRSQNNKYTWQYIWSLLVFGSVAVVCFKVKSCDTKVILEPFSSVPIGLYVSWRQNAVRMVYCSGDVCPSLESPVIHFFILWTGTSTCRTQCCGMQATTRLKHRYITAHPRGTGSRRPS